MSRLGKKTGKLMKQCATFNVHEKQTTPLRNSFVFMMRNFYNENIFWRMFID